MEQPSRKWLSSQKEYVDRFLGGFVGENQLFATGHNPIKE